MVVVIGSALCSGIEAALLAVNPLRVEELAARAKPIRGARRLAKLRQRLNSVQDGGGNGSSSGSPSKKTRKKIVGRGKLKREKKAFVGSSNTEIFYRSQVEVAKRAAEEQKKLALESKSFIEKSGV